MRDLYSNIKILLALFLIPASSLSYSQFLSNLDATKDDALFTTYAAPLNRSGYKIDQGYQLLWNDEESGVQFISADGGNLGIAFRMGNDLRFRLRELYREPVVTASYSDLVRLYYYPFRDIRVEVLFDVYSSKFAIEEIRIRNEGRFPVELSAIPYYYCPSQDSINDIIPSSPYGFYHFLLNKKKDSWMKEHDIPFTENLRGFVSSDSRFDSVHSFNINGGLAADIPPGFCKDLKKNLSSLKRNSKFIKGLIMNRTFRLQPGDQAHLRIVAGSDDAGRRLPEASREIRSLFDIDPNRIIADDEKAYSLIPDPNIADRGSKYLYWSCFSLLRQCMMPAEGLCHYNYYIFSREPKWGWGYGGQVFHESLSMMAYAYMDPLGAMNSQRIFFERQRPDGYINYRTGPYLNETIEYNGKLTSSAPWFNYENLEIYRITKDRKFLREAYESGKKLYRFYVSRRDSNDNGLCEWGGDAELESVRDARVAIWDKVGWPGNFEGPDLNSMLIKEAESLGEMAKILGSPADDQEWNRDAAARKDLINRYLWDSQTGFYYNVNRNNQSFTYRFPDDLKRKEIIGFLPLWAGVADREKAERLLATLKDPGQFWRQYGVPALSASDDYYNPMGYWNGPVWVQWDYLVFRGLLDYGYKEEAGELAQKLMDNMIWHLKTDHVFWEFYSPDEHEVGWNKTYIWAGIAARFILDLSASQRIR